MTHIHTSLINDAASVAQQQQRFERTATERTRVDVLGPRSYAVEAERMLAGGRAGRMHHGRS